MKNIVLPFKNYKFLELLKIIGWESIENWVEFCIDNQFIPKLETFKENKFNYDWIWGVLLPLLSQAYNICNNDENRKIIGISALPGTGKSTLGLFIERLSLELNIKITAVSIDDFYLPKKEMLLAVEKNPWNVSRGFPGSHSTELMKENLYTWKKTGKLNFPTFDKSLNNGFGDRSHWRDESPDLIILEGWFLGVKPNISEIYEDKKIIPPLSSSENLYRLKIQNKLKEYIDIWNLVDFIWHLKPEQFDYLNLWKRQQEKEMFLKKGVSLSNENLNNFLRMLRVSLPENGFEKIKANIRFYIDQDRKLKRFTLN